VICNPQWTPQISSQLRKLVNKFDGDVCCNAQGVQIPWENVYDRKSDSVSSRVCLTEPHWEKGVNRYVTFASHQSALLISCIPRISAHRRNKLSPLSLRSSLMSPSLMSNSTSVKIRHPVSVPSFTYRVTQQMKTREHCHYHHPVDKEKQFTH